MRYGFSVWAKACKCQEFLPPRFLFSAATIFKFATVLFNWVTLALYSSASPGRSTNPGSAGGLAFLPSVSLGGGVLGFRATEGGGVVAAGGGTVGQFDAGFLLGTGV